MVDYIGIFLHVAILLATYCISTNSEYRAAAARFTTHYHTLHVFNVVATFKHYFTQHMMFSSVNTYNFHSNVKEIKKISVNLLFRQRVMASMIFTRRDNPKLLSDHVLTIFRSSCGSGGRWGAFSFHMGKIVWVSVLRLFQASF